MRVERFEGLIAWQKARELTKHCAEVRSQLYVAKDVGYITSDIFERINLQAQEATRIIGGLKVSVQKRK